MRLNSYRKILLVCLFLLSVMMVLVFSGFLQIYWVLPIVILMILIISKCSKLQKKLDNEITKIYSILLDELDPKRAIAALKGVIEKEDLPKGYVTSLEYYIAISFAFAGDFEQSRVILENLLVRFPKWSISYFQKKRRGFYAIIHKNLAGIHLEKGNLKNAKLHDQLMKNFKPRKVEQKSFEYHLLHLECAFKFSDGKYEECLEMLESLQVGAQIKLDEVSINYRLSNIYEKLGNVPKQKELLQSVADSGHKLHIGEIAREKLAVLERYV